MGFAVLGFVGWLLVFGLDWLRAGLASGWVGFGLGWLQVGLASGWLALAFFFFFCQVGFWG